MFKYKCNLIKRMKIKKKTFEEIFRKIHLNIGNFHRVKKDTLVYTKYGHYLFPWK